ncbi:glycosyl hydrolase family 28-related protein [Kitasatospora sp. NPDC006697]|uniref:glycosyl hydrolase family 28-related protein n=1 Tax=Kitasatospora sp. NPDC006697 TaxID=3364020 RepID=UPI00368099D8
MTTAGEGRSGRRALLAGAVAGLTGAAVLGSGATGAAAATQSLDWYSVKDYGAYGDGSHDDTAAVQSAINAAQAAGGTVYFPAGSYLVVPGSSGAALTVTGNGVRLAGAGSKASTLVKGGNGILLRLSGQADPSGAKHLRYCSVENLGFNGAGRTGLLLELYYNDNSYFRDLYLTSNNDLAIDAVEFWDSRFYNLVIESCTGTPDSTSQPNIWLRNTSSATPGTWGYSQDNVNQIHFTGCRLENFGTGALWITQGTAGTNNPNGIYLTDCKFETSNMQGGPHLKADASCRAVYATDIYCFAGGFAQGYAKAQNIIVWSPSFSALENVLIANGNAATVNAGVDLYSGPGSTAVLRNVVGQYGAAPTGTHVYYESSSTGDFRVDGCYGTKGAQATGTLPTANQGNPPLRLVAGPVSDASFTHPPLDGTMAVDTAGNRLYVRVGGVWRWSQLN